MCASVGATIHARRQFKINVVRYADDFVMTGISKEILEHTAPQTIPQCMAVRGPELSEEKTRITPSHPSAAADLWNRCLARIHHALPAPVLAPGLGGVPLWLGPACGPGES